MKRIIPLLGLLVLTAGCDRNEKDGHKSSLSILSSLSSGGTDAGEAVENVYLYGSSVSPAIYVLAGQSNMQGTAAGLGPNPDPRIEMLGLDRQMHIASEPLSRADNAVDTYLLTGGMGVGPGLYFANNLLGRRSYGRIVLVPCAKGSSPMDQWTPNGGLNGLMLERTRAALKARPGSHVAGLLFWQGEADSYNHADITYWPDKFKWMVKAFRAEFGARIPVVYVQIASNGDSMRARMRWSQSTIVTQGWTPNVTFVNAEGIAKIGDHTDEAGYAEMGRRMAYVMANVLK